MEKKVAVKSIIFHKLAKNKLIHLFNNNNNNNKTKKISFKEKIIPKNNEKHKPFQKL